MLVKQVSATWLISKNWLVWSGLTSSKKMRLQLSTFSCWGWDFLTNIWKRKKLRNIYKKRNATWRVFVIENWQRSNDFNSKSVHWHQYHGLEKKIAKLILRKVLTKMTVWKTFYWLQLHVLLWPYNTEKYLSMPLIYYFNSICRRQVSPHSRSVNLELGSGPG